MSAEWERFKKDILDRVDLAEFIGQFTKLRKVGSRFTGLCPLHGDNDPSLSVSPDVGLWHCFGCKEGGDIFNFVMKKESMSFIEAAQLLSDRYQIPLPSMKGDKQDKTPRQAILEINTIAVKFFADYLRSSDAQRFRDYLKQRNINRSIVEKFNIGASPDSWETLTNLLRKKGYKDNLIEQTGLAKSKTKGQLYDCFRNRLMIPIHDNLGRIVGFGGRVIDKSEPKYVNTAESPLFQKSQILFALNLARESIRKEEFVVVMEGYTDVMRAHQMEITNAVASMGTALTPKHIDMLKRLTNKIYLAFDGDSAGIKAAIRSVEELIKAEMQVRVVVFDGGLDPEDFLLQKGKEAFLRKLKTAEVGIWFLVKQILPEREPDKSDEKIHFFNNALEYIRLVPYLEEQYRLVERVARHLVMDERIAILEFEKSKKGKPVQSMRQIKMPEHVEESHGEPDELEQKIIMYIVCFADLRKASRMHIKPSDFSYHPYRKFMEMLFDREFPIATANLAELDQISENDDFTKIVSEMMNSFDSNHEYTIDEFSEFVKIFKIRVLKQKRLKNRKLMQKAIEDKNKELETKLDIENQNLAFEINDYSNDFKIQVENM